jgi:long-chain-fatty-acid--CoA ligase ACSBG
VRILYSGGGTVSLKTLQFFHSLGLPLCELFGMTESTAPHLICWPNHNRILAVGNVNNGFNETKLGENNELLIRGRNIFMGYLNNPEKTKEAFDENGWLHTGDIARIDKDGFVYITGRLNELLTINDGRKIDPTIIEDALKDELKPLVKNCMLVGNNKNFLSVLITLNVSLGV